MCKKNYIMAFVKALLVGFVVALAAGDEGLFFNGEGEMEQGELFGLFEVMSSLLENPSWAEMHPAPCTDTPWPGVECELMEETPIFHVTKIHVGTDVIIPPCKDSAEISESLRKLPYLRTLSLMNCFTQSPVSLSKSVFGALPFLEHLVLESNPTLSGPIPSSLSNLINLKTLCLSQNNLSGEIPGEIGALLNLQQLDLSHNVLTGSIPGEIGSLEKLTILDFSSNSLQGVLPGSFGNLQFLEKIDLSSNKLQGQLPYELGKLKGLVLLDLSHNSLTGQIPETMSGLQQLQYLIMEDNPLNSSIPSFIPSLTRLRALTFSRCGLTGPIPITFSNLKNLAALSLENNLLNGTVPPELATLPRLDALNLSSNHLTGEILFPRDFVHRLGERLDVRENNGLCTNERAGLNNTRSARFLQVPPCPSAEIPTAASNRTLVDGSPNMKPELYRGNKSSSIADGKMIILFPVVVMFLSFLFSS